MWRVDVGFLFIILIQFIHNSQGKNGTCAENEFTCKNGECILAKWKCDAEADCLDSSDEDNCESYPSCASNEFQCNTSMICVSGTWRCDGDVDCGDRSDELGCYFPECEDGQFRCKNNYCIDQTYVCDGDDDCDDLSDEISCSKLVRCKAGQFLCDSNKCHSNSWLCDDDRDCHDGTDEMNCTKPECIPGEWKCGDGDCIAEHHKCDGEYDCSDMSDEMGCPNITIICDEQTQFQCASRHCIQSELVCNGYIDCFDGSDENNCTHGESDCDYEDHVGNNCTTKVEGNSTSCLATQYRCWNDECIGVEKLCDQKIDCQDESDELRCPRRENQTSCSTNRGGCEQLCHDQEGSFTCSCYDGFELDKSDRERKSCKDIDECRFVGFCSQKCVNGHGNYNCSCHKGYALQSDGRKCKALGSKPLLLLSSQAGIKISELKNPSKVRVSMDSLQNAVAVDYWLEGKLFFWTDTVLRTIKSASLNGAQIKNVVKFGLERPCDLAVDWLGKKIFWTDSESGRIEVSNFDGTGRKAIFWQPKGRLRAIALHPTKGYMFWTEWEEKDEYVKSSIARANMDGTNLERILYEDAFWPNSLVVDYANERLFYVDAKNGLIGTSDFDGENIRPIMRNNLRQPFSITIFEDELFWTDIPSKTVFRTSIFDGTETSLIKRNIESPMGITVIQNTRQPSGSYNCEIDNGGCSHICLPKSGGRACACPTGFQMLNSTQCAERINKFVCYVGDYVVRQISLDTEDMLEVVLPFESVLDVIAMDWDPINDEMYWAESNNDEITIRKGKMRPPYHEAVVKKISSNLSSISVDWLTRKLYWCEEERNHILVSNLDGSSSTVLVWRKNLKPRNLLLHVEKRYMYWTSHGSVVSINRAGMDGSFRRKIISNGLVNPTDLTLDKTKNTLYWVDGGNTVNYISLRTRKRNFFTVSHHSTTLSPFSIGVDGNRFFWADSRLKKVLTMKLGETNEGKVIGKYKFNPVKLAVFEQVNHQERNPCAVNNGDCSHLCVLSPSQNYRCLCPAGRNIKADNKSCEHATTSSRFVLVNSNGRLHQVPLNVQYKTSIMIKGEGNQDIFAFDVDIKHRSAYLIKKTTKKKEICYVSLFGGNHTCILSEMLRSPGDIAYDPVGQHIYWTDFLTKKIYLADRKGKFWTVVIWKNLDLPSSITTAYKNGLIFWADLGKQVSISRANMDGSSQSKIVTSRLKWPTSLTVDHMAKHLYWADYLQQRIELCDFYGKNRRQFVPTLAGPTFLTLFSKFVYWSEWQPNVLRKRGKAQDSLSITVMKSLKRVTGIQAVNLRKIPVSKSKCNQNNGGCSHFCLRNTFGVSCACPVGLKLENDSRTCSDSPRNSIFYTSGKAIKRISLDTDDMTSFILPVKYAKIGKNFAFDVTTIHIYWTNGTTIYSSSTADSDSKTVLTAPTSTIKSLAVDWISGNLFWTDFANGKIKVSSLDGSLVADLISHGLKMPRDIVVDPNKGLLFWTDTERKVIERSHTNGQSRTVIVSSAIFNPVGLTADFDTESLYWTDLMYHTIERCNYDGQRRLTVISRDVHAFALAVLGPYVYWTDQRHNALLRADKDTGAQRYVLEKDLERPMQVVSSSRERKNETSACLKNGNCENLCLSTPTGRSCASVCDGILYLKDSCNVQEIVTKPTTFLKPSINCTTETDNKNCTNGSVKSLTKEKKTVKIAYIVGGLVLVAFIIAMSILVFLCQRRLKIALTKGKQKQLMPLRATFESRHSANETDSVNDPLVPLPSKYSDQVSTTSSPSSIEKFPNRYQVTDKNEYEEAKQCLTTSNV